MQPVVRRSLTKTLFVIRLVSTDFAGAINLLKQNDARKVMWKRDGTERERFIGARANIRCNAI